VNACLSCKFDTKSQRLKFGMKNCFMGHRQFLPIDRKFRQNTQSFDRYLEFREAPTPKSGSHTLRQIEAYQKKVRDEGTSMVGPRQWKKKSIFWNFFVA